VHVTEDLIFLTRQYYPNQSTGLNAIPIEISTAPRVQSPAAPNQKKSRISTTFFAETQKTIPKFIENVQAPRAGGNSSGRIPAW
jgi:hypothetical protein